MRLAHPCRYGSRRSRGAGQFLARTAGVELDEGSGPGSLKAIGDAQARSGAGGRPASSTVGATRIDFSAAVRTSAAAWQSSTAERLQVPIGC